MLDIAQACYVVVGVVLRGGGPRAVHSSLHASHECLLLDLLVQTVGRWLGLVVDMVDINPNISAY